jgi:hypothetical protein
VRLEEVRLSDLPWRDGMRAELFTEGTGGKLERLCGADEAPPLKKIHALLRLGIRLWKKPEQLSAGITGLV